MTGEYAWVIVIPSRRPMLMYWAGGTLWSPDNLDAIRFARRIDAERAARYLPEHPNYTIEEHAWCYPAEAP